MSPLTKKVSFDTSTKMLRKYLASGNMSCPVRAAPVKRRCLSRNTQAQGLYNIIRINRSGRHLSCSATRMQAKYHNINTANRSLKKKRKLKYLLLTVTNQKREYIHKESKSKLNARNACYDCLLLFSIKPHKIKTQRNIILHAVTYGCETWSLARNTMFANSVLKGTPVLQERRSDKTMDDGLHNFHSFNH
jgi:hypothetical protein